ncbi:MAG TPA: DinB family protein [Longimicrobium sp.]|jgi:uncharacterized damage-inducible protein DinB
MTAPSLKQTALADLEQELATTRRVLDRVPDEHLDWKPHAKSWSLGALATHLATIPTYGTAILGQDELDASTLPPNTLAASREELLRRFDENVAGLRGLVATTDDDALARTWTFRSGEQVIFQQSRTALLRMLVVSHMVHHRAQLGVYLRLLDQPVPSVYGPSADESPF